MHHLLQQLKDRDRGTYERAAGMADDEVADDPRVRAAGEALGAAEERRRERREANGVLRERVERCKNAIAAVEREAAEVSARRPDLAVRVALGQADDSEDRKAQGRYQDLMRQRELLRIALPGLEADLKGTQSETEYLGRAVVDARLAHESALVLAKIEQANKERR